MKQILLVFALVFTGFGATALCAQEMKANTGEERARPERGDRKARAAQRLAQQVEELKEGLKLDDEQVVAVSEIMKQATVKMQDLRKSGTDRKDMRAKMKPIREEQDAAIEALLTKKQLRRYQNMKAQRDAQRREGGGRQGGRPAGQRG